MLQVREASVVFPASDGSDVQALDRVSLDLHKDSIVVAVGASGCGKSTLLNAVAGFLPLTEGSITLDGERIEGPGGDRGVVFQKDTLLPWASVLDNVALGLRYKGVAKRERHQQARELLGLVGLSEFGDKPPYELLLGTMIVVMSPRPGRIVARFDADFVRDFANSGEIGPIVSQPRFVALREEIRALIHNPPVSRHGALQ